MKPETLIGKTIGQYEIVSLIGQGGMAVVYRARQMSPRRDVAMKVVATALSENEHFLERFNREVEVIASLEHAHIVPVHEHGTTPEGITYLTMRLMRGGTLAERIKSGGALPAADIARILNQIGAALDHAHANHVIHRDLKPNNILLDEQGNAYLADFGLARIVAEDERLQKALTETGSFLGTPAYISPEQVETGRASKSSDIYSLGVILYEMLTGRPPFSAESAFKLMQAHVSERAPLIHRFRPGLPNAVEGVVERVLDKMPTRRYQTATDLAQDFSAAIQATTAVVQERPPLPGHADTTLLSATTPNAPSPLVSLTGSSPTLRRPARARLFAAGAGVAALLIMALVVGLLTLTRAPGGAAYATPGSVDEAQRPATGVPADLTFTPEDLQSAQGRLQGAFIGVMPCTLETGFHASLARSFVTRASALGLPTRVENPNGEKFRQPAILDQFIVQGAKAIFICPIDFHILMPSIKAAQEAGIFIMTTGDEPLGERTIVFTITNEQMGKAVGEYTAQYINANLGGTAQVMILNYPPAPATLIRGNAMEQALRDNAPNATLVGSWPGGLSENGRKSMQEALAAFPNLNVIMSINDAGAFGAVQTLAEMGKRPDEVLIFSVDAEPEAQRKIQNGEYFVASFDNDPVLAGQLAAEASVKMLAGKIVPKQVFLPGQMVTRETLRATPLPSATP
jgi:ABC-type sugar transport system substrate-binding protein